MTAQKSDQVIDLRTHAKYRPDFAALARDQVSSARAHLGFTSEEFARELAPLLGWVPSPELVEGWEARVTPPGDVVLAANVLAQKTSHNVLTVPLNSGGERVAELLSTVMGGIEHMLGSPDLVRAYATRGLVARTEWNSIIRGSQKTIWLYGMSELGYALDDEVPGILEQAARQGCAIRILLLDPEYSGTTSIDTDEGNPAGTLSPRIKAALARFNKMRERCGDQLHIRTYNAPPTVSIVRGDDRMLVTPYLRFFVGSNSPTLELRDTPSGKMFERYEKHFETVWDIAEEWTS